MVKYFDPEEEDTSRVRPSIDPKKRQLNIAQRRERNANLPPDVAVDQAREYALRLLDSAARSSGEIESKLLQRGYQPAVAQEVISRLQRVGLLDDLAYATMLARTRHQERGLVGQALRQELLKKHLPTSLIDQALAQLDFDDSAQLALEYARKKAASSQGYPKEVRMRRISGFLQRKGYSYSQAYAAIRQALEEYPSTLD